MVLVSPRCLVDQTLHGRLGPQVQPHCTQPAQPGSLKSFQALDDGFIGHEERDVNTGTYSYLTDSIVEGLACLFVPNQRGLSLIGHSNG